MWNPKEDGITHINIFSRGNTQLGRFMSNFAYCEHGGINTEDGNFRSIEGYWSWLGTHNEMYRTLYGYQAKSNNKMEKPFNLPEDEFRRKIKAAIRIKLDNHPTYRQQLAKSTLPFSHYYYFGNIDNPVVRDAGYMWLVEYWEELRKELNISNKGETNDSK
jgi:hypothetical protein